MIIEYLYPKIKEVDEDLNKVNLKDVKRFIEVKKDQKLICISYEENINSNLVKVGQNVNLVQLEDKIIYMSAIDGIIDAFSEVCEVNVDLNIIGDVSYETGNLEFSGDINVNGSIHSGFYINCGGNLTIKNHIENKVHVYCNGDLKVKGGVVGESTELTVVGNFTCSYIKDATLKCDSKIFIYKYAYNATITAQDDIKILGNGVKKDNTSSIVGGLCNSRKSIILHSIGSNTNLTKLVAGIDISTYEKLIQLKTYKKVLLSSLSKNKKMIDFKQDKTKFINSLKALNESQIKDKVAFLKKMRSLIEKHDIIQEKINSINDIIAKGNHQNETIQISHHLIPDVNIQIGKLKAFIPSRINNKQIWRISENKLVNEAC